MFIRKSLQDSISRFYSERSKRKLSLFQLNMYVFFSRLRTVVVLGLVLFPKNVGPKQQQNMLSLREALLYLQIQWLETNTNTNLKEDRARESRSGTREHEQGTLVSGSQTHLGKGSISFLFYALLEHDSGNDVDNDHDDDRPPEGMARPRWPRKGRISCSRGRLETGRCWNCGTIFAIFSVGVSHSVKDCLKKIWRIWPTSCVSTIVYPINSETLSLRPL